MKRIVIIFMCLACLLIGTCIPILADASQDHPLQIWGQNKNGQYQTLNVVDERTGVNYIVVGYERVKGGGVAICPRYNADGTLYVTD